MAAMIDEVEFLTNGTHLEELLSNLFVIEQVQVVVRAWTLID
jgi:hypothetical protein